MYAHKIYGPDQTLHRRHWHKGTAENADIIKADKGECEKCFIVENVLALDQVGFVIYET